MQRAIYKFILGSHSADDQRRRELILKILLIGTIMLTVLALITALVNTVLDPHHEQFPLSALVFFCFIFYLLYGGVQRGYYLIPAIIFIAIMLLLVTYVVVRWGILVPQAILTYSLIIIMAGVLFRALIALGVSIVVVASLVVVKSLGDIGVISFDLSWLSRPGNYTDIVVYGFTFGVIALVSWLSNREIERSLAQARRSERALMEERRNLEVKVAQRTKQLEKAQVEKMLEMHRFAELGRMGSALLHDIANPLTAISLTLSQPGDKKNQQNLLKQVREDLDIMERYIEGARRQLRNQSEIKEFSVKDEIQQICDLFATTIREMKVEIKTDIDPSIELKGDSVQFNHIVSNLLSNAIDAYQGVEGKRKPIHISVRKKDLNIYIEVKDFGKGIDKAALPHIFEPFYSTKQEGRKSMGIGLAIAQDTVKEAFAGDISVQSSAKQGTIFTVALPIST